VSHKVTKTLFYYAKYLTYHFYIINYTHTCTPIWNYPNPDCSLNRMSSLSTCTNIKPTISSKNIKSLLYQYTIIYLEL